jgi:hypothetical protein
MSDEAIERVLEREKKVWDSGVDDKGASFGYASPTSFSSVLWIWRGEGVFER